MNTILCAGLLMCVCMVYGLVIPEGSKAAVDDKYESLQPQETGWGYRRHGYGGNGYRGSYGGGHGGGYGGGYGGSYGGGYGGYGHHGHGGYGRGNGGYGWGR